MGGAWAGIFPDGIVAGFYMRPPYLYPAWLVASFSVQWGWLPEGGCWCLRVCLGQRYRDEERDMCVSARASSIGSLIVSCGSGVFVVAWVHFVPLGDVVPVVGRLDISWV